jgi:hypothetical protein
LRERWPGPRYEVHVRFRAPLDFAYKWCTDYTPQDARYGRVEFQRRVLRRSPREVIFEDLWDGEKGWTLNRYVVHLRPPGSWHAESVGSHHAFSADYRLTRLPRNRTQLTLKARRRPSGIGGKNPPKSVWERLSLKMWRNFGKVLERDYRKLCSKRARS